MAVMSPESQRPGFSRAGFEPHSRYLDHVTNSCLAVGIRTVNSVPAD
jgi:hypothetical protein